MRLIKRNGKWVTVSGKYYFVASIFCRGLKGGAKK